MVELEPERGDERRVVEQGVAGAADEVRRDAATREERPEVDRRALDGGVAPAGPLDLGDLQPPRSADWAIDSAWRTFGSNAEVRLANGWPLMWKVLLVEPWTPGQAPVASVYQPAPVLGGAWVSSPFAGAEAPFLQEVPHRRHHALAGVLRDQVLAQPVGGEEDRAVRRLPLAVVHVCRRGKAGRRGQDREQGDQGDDSRQGDDAKSTAMGHATPPQGTDRLSSADGPRRRARSLTGAVRHGGDT